MLKHIYKLLGLIIIFVVALLGFSYNIKEVKIGGDSDEVVSQTGESFPIIEINSQSHRINRLYGYSGNMAAGSIRESITPLDESKSVTVNIDEFSTPVNKLNYEVRLVTTNELIDSGAVSAFEIGKDEHKSAKLKFDVNFKPSTEYTLKMILVTDVSKKIGYYTRLKYYAEDSNFSEKLDFVNDIHNMTIAKDEKLTSYIEPDPAADNSSLAFVDINSSYENITWGSFEPVILTDIIPVVKEYNMETAAVSLAYYARIKMPTGIETFYVKEYYRVKYTAGRSYLLWFERETEAEYDVSLTSVKKSQLKLGISQTKDIELVSNNANTRAAFTRGGNLYTYDLMENKINKIYSQYINDDDYEHKLYRQQDTHILSIDEEGNLCFAVYGYIAHGSYEGKVAVVLYQYSMSDNVTSELLYIPFNMTYQILKQEFEKYCYINSGNVFYFSINNSIYSYSITADRLTCIVNGLGEDDYMVIKDINSYVWETPSEDDLAREICILNMDSGSKVSINAGEGEYVQLTGVIGSNVVYGTGRDKDVGTTAEGQKIYALRNINIVGADGSVVKSYKKKGCYIVNAKVDGNVVYMDRCKKKNGVYRKVSGDNILNRTQTQSGTVKLTSRVTRKALTEWYIDLPASFKMPGVPEYTVTNNYYVTQEHPIYLEDTGTDIRYYVYAKGDIKAAYTSPADAIVYADAEQGVVIDNNNQLIWERGGRYNSHIIAGIENIKASSDVNSMEACAYMLLGAVHVSADIKDIKGRDESILNILGKYTDNAVNLTGCSFDEVLYYVSGDRPVIGMLDDNHAVIITAYTANSVTIYDPVTGASQTMLHTAADSMFGSAGNVFISVAR